LSEPVLRCSFCNKSQPEVRKLIAGPDVCICDECIDVCNDIIRNDAQFTAQIDAVVVETSASDPDPDLGLVFPCALCHLPTTSDEALLIPARGPLCRGCLGEIEAAAAERRDRDDAVGS
jgi:hypothetical protein